MFIQNKYLFLKKSRIFINKINFLKFRIFNQKEYSFFLKSRVFIQTILIFLKETVSPTLYPLALTKNCPWTLPKLTWRSLSMSKFYLENCGKYVFWTPPNFAKGLNFVALNRLRASKTLSKQLCTLFHINILKAESLTVTIIPLPKNVHD